MKIAGRIEATHTLSKNTIAIIHQLESIICINFLLASFPAFAKRLERKITKKIYIIDANSPYKLFIKIIPPYILTFQKFSNNI